MKDKKIFFFQNLRTKKLFLDFKNLKNIRLKIGNKKQKNSILIYYALKMALSLLTNP